MFTIYDVVFVIFVLLDGMYVRINKIPNCNINVCLYYFKNIKRNCRVK